MIFLLLIEETYRDTITDIYHTHKEDMFKIAYKILGDFHEAEDVVQTSILKTYQHLERINLDSKHETKGFVLMVAKNHAINVYNRRKKITYMNEDYIYDSLSSDDVEKNLLDYENGLEISAKLAQVNPRYAQVLTLKYKLDFTTKEIAKILDSSESSTRVILHRAKSALKKVLLEEQGD